MANALINRLNRLSHEDSFLYTALRAVKFALASMSALEQTTSAGPTGIIRPQSFEDCPLAAYQATIRGWSPRNSENITRL
jgi:hypothetical protein